MGPIVPRDATCAIFCSGTRAAFSFFSRWGGRTRGEMATGSLPAIPLFPERAHFDLSAVREFLENSCSPRASNVLVPGVIVAVRGLESKAQMTMSPVHDCFLRPTVSPPRPFFLSIRAERKAGRGIDAPPTYLHGREQPSLTELLPLRSLHSREAVVYAPRHPTDAELMILINVS